MKEIQGSAAFAGFLFQIREVCEYNRNLIKTYQGQIQIFQSPDAFATTLANAGNSIVTIRETFRHLLDNVAITNLVAWNGYFVLGYCYMWLRKWFETTEHQWRRDRDGFQECMLYMKFGSVSHTWVEKLIVFAQYCLWYPMLRYAAGRYERGLGFSDFMVYMPKFFPEYLGNNLYDLPYWQQPFIFPGGVVQAVNADPVNADRQTIELWLKTFNQRYNEAVAYDRAKEKEREEQKKKFEEMTRNMAFMNVAQPPKQQPKFVPRTQPKRQLSNTTSITNNQQSPQVSVEIDYTTDSPLNFDETDELQRELDAMLVSSPNPPPESSEPHPDVPRKPPLPKFSQSHPNPLQHVQFNLINERKNGNEWVYLDGYWLNTTTGQWTIAKFGQRGPPPSEDEVQKELDRMLREEQHQ